jgi:REP element-mobilizing transposase RayT
MANTFTQIRIHFIFSTKNREPWLSPGIREQLWPFMSDVGRGHGLQVIEAGGFFDHSHLLSGLPTTMTLARAMQIVKGESSRWLREHFPECRGFAWQDGYAAFSVNESDTAKVATYIRNQVEHHRVRTFEEEYRAFLRENGIPFEVKYLLG